MVATRQCLKLAVFCKRVLLIFVNLILKMVLVMVQTQEMHVHTTNKYLSARNDKTNDKINVGVKCLKILKKN